MKHTVKRIKAWSKRFLQGTVICAGVLVCMWFAVFIKNSVHEARMHYALSANAEVVDLSSMSFAERYVPPVQLINYHVLPAEDMPISRKDQKCLGSLIHTEAGDQPKLGKYAAAFTVLHRVNLNRSDLGGKTVCGVVNFKTKSKRHGVRWQYDGARHPPKLLTEATIEDMDIAADVLRGRVTPDGWLKDALYYKAPYAKGFGAEWFSSLVPLGRIAGHNFYAEGPATAQPARMHVARR